MKKTVLVSVITGALALFLGFFGGMTYQKGKQQTFKPGNFQQGMVNGARTGTGTKVGNRNGAPVSGKIIKTDATSITVQTADGSNKIVIISDSTKVNKTSETAKTDLKEGEQVMIIGSTDSTTGSITATTINLGSPNTVPVQTK